jgi:hypothetical protein
MRKYIRSQLVQERSNAYRRHITTLNIVDKIGSAVVRNIAPLILWLGDRVISVVILAYDHNIVE